MWYYFSDIRYSFCIILGLYVCPGIQFITYNACIIRIILFLLDSVIQQILHYIMKRIFTTLILIKYDTGFRNNKSKQNTTTKIVYLMIDFKLKNLYCCEIWQQQTHSSNINTLIVFSSGPRYYRFNPPFLSSIGFKTRLIVLHDKDQNSKKVLV